MKRIAAHNSIVRWAGVLGLTTLFVGAISILPAHADDYTRYNRDRNQIHRDIADVRRDEDHLHDLYHRRSWLADHHDWKAVHRLDDEISRLKWHIDHARRNIHQDAQHYHRDEDREYNRDRYGSGIGYNSGYRNTQPNYRDGYGRGDYR